MIPPFLSPTLLLSSFPRPSPSLDEVGVLRHVERVKYLTSIVHLQRTSIYCPSYRDTGHLARFRVSEDLFRLEVKWYVL